jgi:hypothetical protein
MERLVDVFTKLGRRHIWTYSVTLGQRDFHPSLTDFEQEALRRAVDDRRGSATDLTAKVRIA